MKNHIVIRNKINNFTKKIKVSSDKSISIRCVLLASQAVGISKLSNLLESEDVLNTLKTIKKLGISYKKKGNVYYIYGFGLNGFNTEKKVIIDAGNSGTLARLILGLLVKSRNKVKLIGDKSLSKRDFSRVIKPLKLFGANIKSRKNLLPIEILGTEYLRPIFYKESIGSAQVKSSLIFAALNTPGISIINSKKSRNHTELMLKFLKYPINVVKKKEYDLISVKGLNQINNFEYNIPGDNKMGADIKIKNKRMYKGEKIANIHVKSKKDLKGINCPANLNSSAIDEFLIIFLVAARAKGISKFNDLGEMNKKESQRLDLAIKFLRSINVKVNRFKNNISIHGNPNLNLKGKFEMKNFLKDHRIFFLSCITALTLGGRWKIFDKDSINTSFPDFLKILKKVGAKIN